MKEPIAVIDTDSIKAQAKGLVKDLKPAVIKLVLTLVVAYLVFLMAQLCWSNKENLVWGLSHPELFTETRKTYEDFGNDGLKKALAYPKAISTLDK